MIYILAGPDGAGKSTVVEELKKTLKDVIFIKESYTPDVSERYDRLRKVKYLLNCGHDVVYDRATILDDFIYEPVIAKKESVLNNTDAIDVLKQVTIIYFECNDSALQKRLSERGDDCITFEDISNIKKRYEKFFEENELAVWRVNGANLPNIVYFNVLCILERKSFRMAHIVPVNSLEKIQSRGYHMCLANIVAKNPKYAEFYASLAQDHHHWVLMDNGAAEGEQLRLEALLECYDIVQPNEIVLPDTLYDGQDTLRKMEKAIVKIDEHYQYKVPFSLMAVPQGRTLEEWYECVKQMVANPRIKTIGISKFLQIATNDITVRWKAAKLLDGLIKQNRRYDMEAHLLGCGESPLLIDSIRKSFPFVRGCDSAYAYLCTQADKRIYVDTSRPLGEIDFINGKDYDGLENNMQSLEVEIGVFNHKLDTSWR